MKKLLVLMLLAFFVSAKAQTQKFTIKGIFKADPPASKLYVHLVKMLDQTSIVSTVHVVKNTFSFSGSIDEPRQCILSWTEKIPADKSQYLSFILDKGSVEISVTNQLNSAKVEGSKADTDFKAFFDLQKRLLPDFEQFNKDAEAAGRTIKNIDSLKSIFQPRLLALQARADQEQVRFVKNNPDAFISLLVLAELAGNTKNFQLADTLFKQLSPEIKNTPSAKLIYDFIETEIKVSVGAIAPEFSMNDTNSKEVKLSSLRGKYVLVDFWASWCGPCRQENPNVVNAYQAFKDKGFTILGISLDRDRSDWLNAIKDDGLTWTQLSDLKFRDNAVAKLYGVTSIPSNFLLDPNGKIIARNLRGPELDEKLKELFKDQ